jgi:hypothetical protein
LSRSEAELQGCCLVQVLWDGHSSA